jgi:ABC-type lipoprotein export system ATPase subunit
VAKKLLSERHVILANKPTGNVDTARGKPLFRQRIEINEKQGVAFIILTQMNLSPRGAIASSG